MLHRTFETKTMYDIRPAYDLMKTKEQLDQEEREGKETMDELIEEAKAAFNKLYERLKNARPKK